MSRASDISAAAAQWLIRLEAETSPELWDAFQSWLDDDPRHRAAFVRLRTAWTRVDQLKSLRPANGSIDSDLLTPRRVSATALATDGLHPLEGRRRRRPRDLPSPLRRRLLATAAAVAGITVASWASIYASSWRVYETDVGGLKQVALNDGTTVDLNTNTALETRISGTRRDIRLVRGEALFHVAHDSTRPFYVIAGTTIVRAVGTSFSVRLRDSDHVDVLVAEGRVAVGPPGTRDPDRPALFPTASTVGAGESASVKGGSVAVTRLLQQEVNRKLAWTAGHLAFRGETLEEAVEEFNRYNQRQLTIGDGSIREVRVGGIFLTKDPQSFVAALRRPFGIRAATPPGTAEQRNGDIRLMAEDGPPQ